MLASSELDSLSIEQIEYRKKACFGGVFLNSSSIRISNNRQINSLLDMNINNSIIGENSFPTNCLIPSLRACSIVRVTAE